jgi:hypothetical protein
MLDMDGIISVLRLITGVSDLTLLSPCYTIPCGLLYRPVMSLSNLHSTIERAFSVPAPTTTEGTMKYHTHSPSEVSSISRRYEVRLIGYALMGEVLIPVFGKIGAKHRDVPEWFDLDPEETAYEQTRQDRLLRNGGHHTQEEWEQLCAYYNYSCVRCGKTGERLTKDHVIPVTKGGKDYISNIQPLCISCNSRKYTKIEDYR